MKFINAIRLAAFFELDYSHVDDELVAQLRELINSHFAHEEHLNILGDRFVLQELTLILDQLKEDKIKVFHGWIEQDVLLAEYLISNGNKVVPNKELVLPDEHQLFKAYQVFVSTYLLPILTQKIRKAIEERDVGGIAVHLKFAPLLLKKKRIEIQGPVSQFLNQRLGQLKVSQNDDLKRLVHEVFSYSFVEVLNALDEEYYSDAIAYIDTAKLLVLNTTLSSSQLNTIKTAISNVSLNNNHRKQVLTFVQSEAFSVHTKHPRTTFGNMIRSPLFFITLIIVIINFLFFFPSSNSIVEQDLEETTGLDGLSADELKVVDTMLGFQQDSVPLVSEKLPSAIPPKYILTANWESIENSLAKEIYSSMIADYEIQKSLNLMGNCSETKTQLYGKSLYSGVASFSDFTRFNHEVINNSNEDLYVLLFEPSKNGKVYGELIASGRTSKVYLKKGDQMIFYSGKQMNSFHPMRRENNGYGTVDDAQKISSNFKYHFCNQSIYHFQQLNSIHTVDTLGDVIFEDVSNGFGVVIQ